MKNSIIIVLIAFGAMFTTSSLNANTYLPMTPTLSSNLIKVTITVNFGRQSKGCSGFGVCSVVISAELMARPSNTSGTGTAEVENGKLILTLNKSSMTREAMTKYFSNNKFTVEEDFQVAHEIVSPRDPASGQATGRRQYQPIIIRKGVYDVQDNGATLTLKF